MTMEQTPQAGALQLEDLHLEEALLIVLKWQKQLQPRHYD